MKITTVWPRDWRPRAASMTRRSAPPMPRSGWMKMIVFFFGGADFSSEAAMIFLGRGGKEGNERGVHLVLRILGCG